MARRTESVIYLDTHIVVWLYAGLTEKLTTDVKEAIDNCDVYISQICRLELQYLYEIGRIRITPPKLIAALSKAIDLKVSVCVFSEIVDEALKIKWTRDAFDRLLVGEVRARKASLITADENIRTHFRQAVW